MKEVGGYHMDGAELKTLDTILSVLKLDLAAALLVTLGFTLLLDHTQVEYICGKRKVILTERQPSSHAGMQVKCHFATPWITIHE